MQMLFQKVVQQIIKQYHVSVRNINLGVFSCVEQKIVRCSEMVT